MPEVIVEKRVCTECGVDVRNETLFCYNCGSRVADTRGLEASAKANGQTGGASVETKAALEDLAEKLRDREEHGDKLARAADQRRKARIGQRKPRKIVWEPTGDSSQGLILILAVAVAVITLVVVLLTVVWK